MRSVTIGPTLSRQTIFLLAQWHFSQAIPSSSTNPWKKRTLEPRLADGSASRPCQTAVFEWFRAVDSKNEKHIRSRIQKSSHVGPSQMSVSAKVPELANKNFGVWLGKRPFFWRWWECQQVVPSWNAAHESKAVSKLFVVYIFNGQTQGNAGPIYHISKT